jgi:cobalt-zinc-cadmium resistance protein CzcA
LDLPTGYFTTWGGQFEQQQRAMARLRVMVPLALVLIFILLFINFGSIRPVFLILANIPFALVGGVFALKLSGLYLSVSASVGFIALFGIAILNGLVMIEFFRNLEQRGSTRRQAILEGAELRLRPVLMTAAITALGLIPLVWATGVGSEVQRPLAVVVVSGVVTSTLLTLFVLPILYQWFGSGLSVTKAECESPDESGLVAARSPAEWTETAHLALGSSDPGSLGAHS